MSALEVKVPDIGDFKDVPVIEVLVKPGDTVAAEDSLITLECDKATMEVPSPSAGMVKEVRVKVGDKVSEGTLIAMLDAERWRGETAGARGAASAKRAKPAPPPPPRPRQPAAAPAPAAPSPPAEAKPAAAPPPPSTPNRSRPHTQRRRCASSRASWASIFRA